MGSQKHSTVVGVFADRTQAQQAVAELRKAGFREDQIGVVGRDTDGHTTTETGSGKGSHIAAGAATGAATGAGVGALWALGIAAGMLPAIGPVIAGGLLASVIASAAGGAAVAGVVGALIGLGIPEHEAKYYEGEVHAGRILVTVKADARYDEAAAILRRYGAYDMSSGPACSTTSSAMREASIVTSAGTAGQRTPAYSQTAGSQANVGKTVQRTEEELRAHKTPVKTGEVRIRKEVVTENQTLEVPVTREEVVIERHPASGRATSEGMRPGEEIRIPVTEEQVRVEKEVVVKEEVNVAKRKVSDTEHVAGTVKKEQIKVERDGKVDVRTNDTTKQEARK